VACLVAVLALLVFWAVNSGGGGGGNGANGSDSHTPVSSITPGPSATGPLNSSRPGGSVGGGSGGSGSGGGDTGATDGGSGSGGSAGATSSSSAGTAGTADGGTSSGGSGGGTSGAGEQLAAGSTLPDCASGSVTLTLRSAQNSYEPGVKPQFKLTASNSGSTACKLDFGATAAVFTVTDVDDNHVWASDDCPAAKSAYLLQVPAGSTTTYVVTWNRTTSSPNCATPKGAKAATGTYLVETKLSGFGAEQTSFVLKND
jgi:hypothetical protein